jgi:hypothetical protein
LNEKAQLSCVERKQAQREINYVEICKQKLSSKALLSNEFSINYYSDDSRL